MSTTLCSWPLFPPSLMFVCLIVCLFVWLFVCLIVCLFVCLFVCSFQPPFPHGSSYQTTQLCYTNSTLLTVHRCLGRSSSFTVGWRMSAGNSRKSTALPSNSGKITDLLLAYMYDTLYMCQQNLVCTPSHQPQTVPQKHHSFKERYCSIIPYLLSVPVLPSNVQTHTTHTLRLHPHTSLKH